MKILYPFIAVLALGVVGYLGGMSTGGQYLFGVVLPYLAFAVFLGGFWWKVINWGKSPVPFRIPTTCGQEESLPWIKQSKIDNPSTTWGVVRRMFFEVFLFRSLFRNTKAEIQDGPKLVYGSSKYLWLFALLFHYCFLVIVLRHLRLFTNPIPGFRQRPGGRGRPVAGRGAAALPDRSHLSTGHSFSVFPPPDQPAGSLHLAGQ